MVMIFMTVVEHRRLIACSGATVCRTVPVPLTHSSYIVPLLLFFFAANSFPFTYLAVDLALSLSLNFCNFDFAQVRINEASDLFTSFSHVGDC